MQIVPRVALFADTFHEINGAANVLRRLVEFARAKGFPFLCIRAGEETDFRLEGSVNVAEIRRSRASLPVDGDLRYDPLLWRKHGRLQRELAEFRPDVVHVTGLNDVSQIGFLYAHRRSLPAVASWHTNTHEYAARRMCRTLGWLPQSTQRVIGSATERFIMSGLMKLYFLAQVQLAPNRELVEEIQKRTRRPSFLMSRGVDTELFHPCKRRRDDSTFVMGFVGRLRPEKNVRMFAEIGRALENAGVSDFKFVFVGEGSETEWLRANVKNAEIAGVLRGEQLAQKFADMDLFVFPSKTDAFGNVVLEAMACGVPAVVMPDGGPKYLIRHGRTGFVARDDHDFIDAVVGLAKNPDDAAALREEVRQAASERSWERVFESVYEKYRLATMFSKDVRV